MYQIETPEEKDLEKLAGIMKERFVGIAQFDKSKKSISDYLKNDDGDILVIKEDNDIIGGCLLEVEANEKENSVWRIRHFAVTKKKRNKKVADFFINEIDRKIREKIEAHEVGKVHIEIHVLKGDKKSIKFYQDNNYEMKKTIKHHYGKGKDCVVLVKEIG
ncbi:MAG: GNAT family N-acetyltransferase [Candidatus Woesearchaeota archaeon]